MNTEFDPKLIKTATIAPKINPDDLEDVICGKPTCGGKEFVRVENFKKIPITLSPTGQEAITSVPFYRCFRCGTIVE